MDFGWGLVLVIVVGVAVAIWFSKRKSGAP